MFVSKGRLKKMASFFFFFFFCLFTSLDVCVSLPLHCKKEPLLFHQHLPFKCMAKIGIVTQKEYTLKIKSWLKEEQILFF